MRTWLERYGPLMGLLGEFYGKTPDELLDMTLEDFTLAFNCYALLAQARDEARAFQREMDHEATAAKQALASLG